MRGELQIFATGGVVGLRLKKSDKYELITEDYRGETIVFSNEIEILGFDADEFRERDPPITCQSLRLFMTPLRDDMYVEIDGDYDNQVYLMEIEQESFLSTGTISFRSDEARPSFTCELERGVSIFDDFNTEKKVKITVDKNYETIWNSNIGPTTRGSNFKAQFLGMFVYAKKGEMTFQTFFDELQFLFNSDETLKIKLLVQGRAVFSVNIPPKSVQGAVYEFRFIIKEDTEDDTDTEESSDEEDGRLPPAETPEGMVRINGFLTARPASPPAAAPPMPRRRRLRPRRRRGAIERAIVRPAYNPNETTTRFRSSLSEVLSQAVIAPEARSTSPTYSPNSPAAPDRVPSPPIIPRQLDFDSDDDLYSALPRAVSVLPRQMGVTPAHVVMSVVVTSSDSESDEDN